jgi:hypothetical protein
MVTNNENLPIDILTCDGVHSGLFECRIPAIPLLMTEFYGVVVKCVVANQYTTHLENRDFMFVTG